MNKVLQIAIDGPVAAGCSSLAKALAQKLGLIYIDTGAMYRAATWVALNKGFSAENLDETQVTELVRKAKIEAFWVRHDMEGNGWRAVVLVDENDVSDDIRTKEVDKLVARVAAMPAVRKALVEKQQQMARGRGVVMEGRDIGTVVLPEADLKIYLDAQVDIRVKRRYEELVSKGMQPTFESLKRRILERDEIDKNREDSPLKPASDAWVIDTSRTDLEKVVQMVVARAEEKMVTK